MKGKRKKLLLSHQVSDWRACGATAHQLAKALAAFLVDCFVEVRVKLHPLTREDVGQHHFGVKARAGRSVAPQIVGGPIEQAPDGP